jgi:hypothetical protein
MTRSDRKAKDMEIDENFDCVEMKRRIQAEIYEETKDLTPDQVIEYYRKSAEEGPWGDWWKKVYREAEAVRENPPERSDDGAHG